MHISLLTATGKYNLGDELILRQEFLTLKKAYPNATFSVFTYDPKSCLIKDDSIEFLSFFPNGAKSEPLANIGYLIKNILTIAKSDFIVIGGGGLIYDRETQTNMFPIWQWIFRVAIAKVFRIPLVWWAVGINITQDSNKKYLSFLFGGKNTLVTVRDANSQALLRNIGITGSLLPDPVLGYTPHPDDKKSIPQEKPLIGISLRSGYIRDESTFFPDMLATLRESGSQIVFLSQSLHPEDQKANDAIFAKSFAQPGDIITTSLPETLTLYPRLDFVIGMRLHSLILAMRHQIPFLALSYETKTREFLRSIEYSHVLDTESVQSHDFKQAFDRLKQEAVEVKFALGTKNDTMSSLSESGKQLLLSQIDTLLSLKK